MNEPSSKIAFGSIILIALFIIQIFIKKDNQESDSQLNLDPSQIAALTITPGYTSCENSMYPEVCDSIHMIWNSYRLESTDPLDKVELLSSGFIQTFKANMRDALYLDRADLLDLEFVDQIRIIQNRSMLLESHTKQELNNLDDDDILVEGLYLTLGIESTRNKLVKIKFVSDKSAFGIFLVFGQEKSVFFNYEKNKWTINIYKEDTIFSSKREQLQQRMLSNYKSTEEYLIDVFDEKYLGKIKV